MIIPFHHHSFPRPPPLAGTRQSARVTRGRKKKAGDGEEEDSEQPNTYDYNDSFIDDDGEVTLLLCHRTDCLWKLRAVRVYMSFKALLKPLASP